MYTLQQQYNLVPNQYANEMRTVTVLPHLKSIIADCVAGLAKVLSISSVGKRQAL